MAIGNTQTGSLADSLQLIIDSARLVREHEGVFMRTTETHTLDENTGLSWEEIAVGQLTAQAVTETTVLDNPQSYSDTLFTITPSSRSITYRASFSRGVVSLSEGGAPLSAHWLILVIKSSKSSNCFCTSAKRRSAWRF